MSTQLSPLYMWAGGKTRLVKQYEDVWPSDHHLEYVEPFFGGGAVFCWRTNTRSPFVSHLGDVNIELIQMLEQIKHAPEPFIKDAQRLARQVTALEAKEARKEWYYRQRELYWRRPTPSRLYVLMRTGFNGIWQTCEASKGLFGTPAGLLNQTKSSQIIDPGMIRLWSAALQSARLHSGSYEGLPLPTRALIYLDPPYRDSFTSYGTGFNDDDQKVLAGWYRDRVAEGHTVVLANRCVDGDRFFEDLIGDICDFYYFDVTYTAGRRKRTDEGFEAKPAREFVAISKH